MDLNCKIMVVCGGCSTEREVSLKSGKAVYNGLKKYGFNDVQLFDLNEGNLAEIIREKPDIVYLALHGKGGEDGTIQGMLELANIPYTGPGVLASAIGIDKIATKRMLFSADIPSPRFITLNIKKSADYEGIKKEIVEKIGIPAVIKSPCQGSSIGVFIAKTEDEIEPYIREVLKLDSNVLVEQFVSGIEVTLPILGNEEIMLLPAVEIVSEREFYDYTAKYTQGMCHHIIPARISSAQLEELERIGTQVYRLFGCSGISRIDFIIDEVEGPQVIEINTLPGMTEMSLVPDSAKVNGIRFEDLVAMILKYGMERFNNEEI